MTSKVQALSDLLKGTDIVGDGGGSLEGLRRYHAAKAAVNGNRRCVISDRLTSIRSALKCFCVGVTTLGSKIVITNRFTHQEIVWD
jgi:hypothetical protein